MSKQECVICQKNLGRFATKHNVSKRLNLEGPMTRKLFPAGYTPSASDVICDDCIKPLENINKTQKCLICQKKIGRFATKFYIGEGYRESPELLKLLPADYNHQAYDVMCKDCSKPFNLFERAKNCIICQKKLNSFNKHYVSKLNLEHPETRKMFPATYCPQELDAICNDCIKPLADFDKRNMVKNKEEWKKRVEEYKKQWVKNGVVQFKNERVAILHRAWGAQVEFIIAFDDLTKEGYRCVAQDEGKEVQGSFAGGGVSSYYYFQKLEYIGFENKHPNP